MNKYTTLLLGSITLSLTACGGSESSGSSTTPAESNNTPQVLNGRLVDSAVTGMGYETATRTGTTDANGTFEYLANETVTFSLGDITLPAVQADTLITPLDIFATNNIGDARVINLTRLLQTLDTDGDATNGITLSSEAAASATGLSVDFTSAEFDNQVGNLVANSGSVYTALITGETALDHFQETLFNEGIQQRPQAPDNNNTDTTPDPTNTSNHPLVGTTAEFSNFSHGISGTLTILDDRTLEITNFSYDGGGPAVYFYLGTDGNYRNGIQVGSVLNGRTYNNETLMVSLPDNITLDDFNGISVWCDLFSVNFGDARF
ncbi:MAG: DM13 domain-containing protein [Pseudomonadota bacterium]